MARNVETLKQIYGAFGRGDIGSGLVHFDLGVVWAEPKGQSPASEWPPWRGRWRCCPDALRDVCAPARQVHRRHRHRARHREFGWPRKAERQGGVCPSLGTQGRQGDQVQELQGPARRRSIAGHIPLEADRPVEYRLAPRDGAWHLPRLTEHSGSHRSRFPPGSGKIALRSRFTRHSWTRPQCRAVLWSRRARFEARRSPLEKLLQMRP